MDQIEDRPPGGADCPPLPCCCCCEPCPPCPPIKDDVVITDICGPEACAIFGHFDEPYEPDLLEFGSPRRPPSLGVSLGVAHSTSIIKTNLNSSEHQQLRFATTLKAFAKIYLLDEKKWNNEVIDSLITEGEQLVQDSQDYEPDQDEDNNVMAYNKNEIKVKREFDLDGCIFQIELGQKFYLSEEMNLEVKQKWDKFYTRKPPAIREGEEEELIEEVEEEEEEPDPDLPIQEFKQHMRAFYQKNTYGVIQFNDNRYLLVWKEYRVFFVLDFFGRRLNDLMTDLEAGVATMIVLKTMNNLLYLILRLTNLQENDVFNIREIKVVRLTGPDGRTFTQEYGWRKNQFEIINYDYAFLRARLSLSMNRASVIRNRSALPVGIAAILASKIDHPALWNKRVMDRIICYGVNVCRQCWLGCAQKDKPINLSEFPRNLKMGQFWIRYDLYPMKYEGLFKCVPNQEKNELALAIRRAFDAGDNYLLLQVSNQMYALWRKRNDFYYIFDPYRHRVIGYDPKPGEDPKTSSLRMFCVFDKFVKVLNNILSQYTRASRFYIHVVKVRRIKKTLQETTEEEQSSDDANCEELEGEEDEEGGTKDDEIKSLNEEICFDEDEIRCRDEPISDFTEEEEEIPISEYEEEIAPGEEEEGGPEELQLGEFGGRGKRKKKKKKKKAKKKGDTGEEHAAEKPEGEKEQKKKKAKKEKKKEEDKTVKTKEGEAEKECPKVEGGKAKKLFDRYMEQARCLADEFKLREPGRKEAICSEDPDHKMPPNYGAIAYDMAVVGSESGSFESICKLLRSGFKHADRVYLMTPWSNYVVFRAWNLTEKTYFLFDGCTCNVNRFRYLDLTTGTSGLMSFSSLSDIVNYIIDSCQIKCSVKENREKLIDDICNQFCV